MMQHYGRLSPAHNNYISLPFFYLESRKHLPKSVLILSGGQRSADNLKKVVYILNRGGRFQDYKDMNKGDRVCCKPLQKADQFLPGKDGRNEECLHRQVESEICNLSPDRHDDRQVSERGRA